MPRWLVPHLVLATLVIPALSGCASRAGRSPSDLDLGPVGDFSLVDQTGRTVTQADLLGKVWVASFIFTRCGSVCPQVTANLVQLQRDLKGQDGVMLVSFSVDPDHDTPAVLKAYADAHGADSNRWWFLTGDRDQVYRLIGDRFHLAVAQTTGTARTPGNEVIHSSRLVVVDRRGHVRSGFEGRTMDEKGQPVNDLPKLKQLVAALVGEKP